MHRKPQGTKEVVLNWERGAQICFPGDPNKNQEGHVQLHWQVGAICILDIRNSSSRETRRHQTAYCNIRGKEGGLVWNTFINPY